MTTSEGRKFHLHIMSIMTLLSSAKLQVCSLNDSFEQFKMAPMSSLLSLTNSSTPIFIFFSHSLRNDCFCTTALLIQWQSHQTIQPILNKSSSSEYFTSFLGGLPFRKHELCGHYYMATLTCILLWAFLFFPKHLNLWKKLNMYLSSILFLSQT